jgi:hypothetical protein
MKMEEVEGLLSQPCADADPARAVTTAEPSALASLLARVEVATGANYDLEYLIASALEPERLHWLQTPPRYTASLDAALALVERVLPPETSFVLRKSTEGYWVRKGIPAGCWGVILNDAPGWTVAKTPALALLAALLRAVGTSDAELGPGRT